VGFALSLAWAQGEFFERMNEDQFKLVASVGGVFLFIIGGYMLWKYIERTEERLFGKVKECPQHRDIEEGAHVPLRRNLDA
jgi:hypothetical protein